ncbi:hypothetical protein BOX15_Mlig024317g2, partial [Macrostomum lignano]
IIYSLIGIVAMTTSDTLLARAKDPVSQLLALAEEQRLLLQQQQKQQSSSSESATSNNLDPFQPGWLNRLALCDSLSRLLFLDMETALDRKFEQELWNVCFKEPVAAAQREAKLAGSSGQAKLAALLEYGIGFYTNLLHELCTVFQVSLPCRKRQSHGPVLEPVVLRVKAKWPTAGSLAYLCQHCLVHLGDLCRYQRRLDQAKLYYNWAVQTCPSNGHPFNQLAILASQEENRQVATFFHYIRAMSCATPFTAARANLEKLLTSQAHSAKTCLSAAGSGHERPGVLFLHYHALLIAARDVARAKQLWDAFVAAYALRPDTNWEDCVHLVAIHAFAMHRMLAQGEPDNSELLLLQRHATAQLMELLADISHAALASSIPTAAAAAAALASPPQLAGLHTLLRWCNLKPAASLQHQRGLARLACLLNRLQSILIANQASQSVSNDWEQRCLLLPEMQLLQGFLPLFPKLRSVQQQQQQSNPSQQKLAQLSSDSIGQLRANACVQFGLRLAASLPACLLAQQAPGSDATAAWSFTAPADTAAAGPAAVNKQEKHSTTPPKRPNARQQNVALQSLLSNRGPSAQAAAASATPASPVSTSSAEDSASSSSTQPRGKLVLSSEIARSIQEHAAQVASAKATEAEQQSQSNSNNGSSASASQHQQQRLQQQQQQSTHRIQQLPPRFQRKLLGQQQQQQQQQQKQQQQQQTLSLLAKKESEPIFPAALFQCPPPGSPPAAATGRSSAEQQPTLPSQPPLSSSSSLIGPPSWPIGAVPSLESLIQNQPQQQQFNNTLQFPSNWPPKN